MREARQCGSKGGSERSSCGCVGKVEPRRCAVRLSTELRQREERGYAPFLGLPSQSAVNWVL